MKVCLSLTWVLLSTPLLFAETYAGKCVGVRDGGNIWVMKAARAVKIRLEGIDCPELGQDFGTRAKQFTSDLVFGKDVEIKEYSRDKYRRMVARVYVQGEDVSLELVKAGLAWHFKKYSSDPVLAEAEEQARKAKTGLWSMPNPVPPWDYRKSHKWVGISSLTSPEDTAPEGAVKAVEGHRVAFAGKARLFPGRLCPRWKSMRQREAREVLPGKPAGQDLTTLARENVERTPAVRPRWSGARSGRVGCARQPP